MTDENQGLIRPAHFAPVPISGYELVDSGEGWKLERFGSRLLSRPDPQALWKRGLSLDEWKIADLRFKREEDRRGKVPAGIPQGKGGRRIQRARLFEHEPGDL